MTTNCKRAWDVEADFVPDESRLRLSSRYCSFSTYLSCKPIKNGLTIYCLNFCRSKFLYNFEVFTGKEEQHGRGMPTDNTPLDENSEEYLGYIYPLLHDRLIGPEFDETSSVCYGDKAMTSFRLARALARRGIGYVGMLRTAGRPKVRPNGDENAWPFKGGNKADVDLYPRGHLREAYTKLRQSKRYSTPAQLFTPPLSHHTHTASLTLMPPPLLFWQRFQVAQG